MKISKNKLEEIIKEEIQRGIVEFLAEKEESEDKAEEEFKPHMMYDPKTGKGKMTKKYEDHVKLDKKGWVHDKPDVKEAKAENAQFEEFVRQELAKVLAGDK